VLESGPDSWVYKNPPKSVRARQEANVDVGFLQTDQLAQKSYLLDASHPGK